MSFLKKIAHFFESIFRGLRKPAKVAIHWGVVITEKMKTVIDSEGADVLTDLIPGTIDDKVKEKLRAAIPDILVNLKLADECAGETDPAKLTACALRVYQSIPKPFKNDFSDALATQISIVAADGKLTWDEAKTVLKWYHDHEWNKSEEVPASITESEDEDTTGPAV